MLTKLDKFKLTTVGAGFEAGRTADILIVVAVMRIPDRPWLFRKYNSAEMELLVKTAEKLIEDPEILKMVQSLSAVASQRGLGINAEGIEIAMQRVKELP
jgi:hypothetical protein